MYILSRTDKKGIKVYSFDLTQDNIIYETIILSNARIFYDLNKAREEARILAGFFNQSIRIESFSELEEVKP